MYRCRRPADRFGRRRSRGGSARNVLARRDRVEPARAERMAACDTTSRKPSAPQHAVLAQRLDRVVRARRQMTATRRQDRRQHELVEPHCAREDQTGLERPGHHPPSEPDAPLRVPGRGEATRAGPHYTARTDHRCNRARASRCRPGPSQGAGSCSHRAKTGLTGQPDTAPGVAPYRTDSIPRFRTGIRGAGAGARRSGRDNARSDVAAQHPNEQRRGMFPPMNATAQWIAISSGREINGLRSFPYGVMRSHDRNSLPKILDAMHKSPVRYAPTSS